MQTLATESPVLASPSAADARPWAGQGPGSSPWSESMQGQAPLSDSESGPECPQPLSLG